MNYFFRNFELFLELTKREFSGRYLESFGGFLWSFIQPLFLLCVYTVAFGIILKTRWGFAGNTIDYALILFAGLIIFNTFTEVLNKSPLLIINNHNFVKKVVFPLELLPVITVASALLNASISVIIWLIGYCFLKGVPHGTVLMFPFVFLCLAPLLLGFSWLVSALGVFIRDLGPITGMVSHALLFLTPIFYSANTAPDILRKFFLLNPLTYIVEQIRIVLFYGNYPSFKYMIVYFSLASIFAFLSYLVFKRLKPNFANVI